MAKTGTKSRTSRKTPSAARAKKTLVASKPAKQARPARSKAAKVAQGAVPFKARPKTETRPGTKHAVLIARLRRKNGASIAELVQATGWQAHSVRGAISGTLKKKLGLTVTAEKVESRGRVYRVSSAR